jgi:hypothetical protein
VTLRPRGAKYGLARPQSAGRAHLGDATGATDELIADASAIE